MQCQIKELDEKELFNSVEIIRASFDPIAKEFNVTEEKHPFFAAFITNSKLMEVFSCGMMMFGIFIDSKQVGFVALEKKDNSIYFIKMLSVLPEYRHNGYGKELLDYSKEKVKELNGSKILIFLIYENKRLLNWYERYGFVQTGLKKLDDLPFTNCFMEFIV